MNATNISSDYKTSDVEIIIRETWLSVVFVFGIIGNLTLLTVIWRKGSIANVNNLFNLNLAVSDLIRIFLFIPVYLAYSGYGEWPPRMGIAGCKGTFMVVYSSLTVSIFTLMFMSMERYRAVVHPFKKQMNVRQARYLVLLSWPVAFISSIWLAISLGLTPNDTGRILCQPRAEITWLKITLVLLLVGTQWIPGIVFTVAYVKTILKLRRDGVVKPSDISQSSQNRHRRNRRAARILVIEVVTFVVCLYPSYQLFLEEAFGDLSHSADPASLKGMITFCMMMTYSLANPIAHLTLNSEFRAEIAKLVGQMKVLCHLETKQSHTCPHCIRHSGRSHTPHHESQQNDEKAFGEVETTPGYCSTRVEQVYDKTCSFFPSRTV